MFASSGCAKICEMHRVGPEYKPEYHFFKFAVRLVRLLLQSVVSLNPSICGVGFVIAAVFDTRRRRLPKPLERGEVKPTGRHINQSSFHYC